MTDNHNHNSEGQQQITTEDLVKAYNAMIGENNKLRKVIDQMAIKVARHTVEVTERDVVIDTLKSMLTPQQGAEATAAVGELEEE